MKAQAWQRGMTVVEVMAAFFVIAIFFTLIGFGVQILTRGDAVETYAENEVREHVGKLGMVATEVSCANIADGEGYVGCQARAGGLLYTYECRGKFSFGHGCRLPKLQSPNPPQSTH